MHVLKVLRMEDRLGWGDVLDLTRELNEPLAYKSPREARAILRRAYDEDRWIGQPWRPLLIVEKDTMVPVCELIARRWRMASASSRGYSSVTLQHDVALMIERHAVRLKRLQVQADRADLFRLRSRPLRS